MLEGVDEVTERWVIGLALAGIGELCQVQRQRAVGTEHAKSQLLEPRFRLEIRVECDDIRRRKAERWPLRDAYRVVHRLARLAEPRPVRVHLLDAPQSGKERVVFGRTREIFQHCGSRALRGRELRSLLARCSDRSLVHHSTCRPPMRTGHCLISPRVAERSCNCVKELRLT